MIKKSPGSKFWRFTTAARLSYFIVIFSLLVIQLPSNSGVLPAYAQLEDDLWGEPVNLSSSGATENPLITMDSTGRIHVLWVDSFVGTLYSYYDQDTWSDPVPANLIFGSSRPVLVSDDAGLVHAFWIDSQGRVSYSQVAGSNFSQRANWRQAGILFFSGASLTASTDAAGGIHTAYVRTIDGEESPSGIYYRNSNNEGRNWNIPLAIYTSPYLRGQDSQSTNVSLASATNGDDTDLYLAWDNRLRKQVFLTHSTDGGNSWSDNLVMDWSGRLPGTEGPNNIQVSAAGQTALAIWQSGDENSACFLNYRFTTDRGSTWSEPQSIPGQYSSCPSSNQLFAIGENLFILAFVVNQQVNLQAWNGEAWTDSQAETRFSSFREPETNARITLDCLQGVYNKFDEALWIVGCDTSAAGDIWVTRRSMGDISQWYPEPSIWSKPGVISSGERSYDQPVFVAGQGSFFHFLWVQPESSSPGASGESSISYSRYDGERWTRPAPILKSPNGFSVSPDAVVNRDGRLLSVWSDKSGKLYFSGSEEVSAPRAGEWLPPVELPVPVSAARSPKLLASPDGLISVAFVVPLNEQRGVYIIHSEDGGRNWGEPAKIFDAAAAGWEMVEEPIINRSSDGTFHLMFEKRTLPGGRGSLGLYYARSAGKDLPWSESEPVTEESVYWTSLVVGHSHEIHRLWQKKNNLYYQILHQYSVDGGSTWTQPASLSSFFNEAGFTNLVSDQAGVLHLLHLTQGFRGENLVQYWVFKDQAWSLSDNLDLQLTEGTRPKAFLASISPAGTLPVVFTYTEYDSETGRFTEEIAFTSRAVELLAAPDIPVSILPTRPTDTPDPVQAADPTPTSIVNPVELIDIPTDPGPRPASNSYSGLILGAGLATMLVGLVFGVGIVLVKRKNKA
jgi:hypothetical protein